MKLHLLAPSLVLLSWTIAPIARAQTNSLTTTDIIQTDTSSNAQPEPSVLKSTTKALPSETPNLDISRLSDFERLHTSAKLLVQQPTQSKPSLIQTPEDATYGPTQNIYYRTGTLDSQSITGRVEHQWQITPNYKLTWGVDLQNQMLKGETLSTVPNRIALNETENIDRFHTALFALNTWKLTDSFQMDLGLRQNFNSEFGSYLNPSVGTRWAVTPSVAVRGSWASVQRNPGLDQLYVYDTVHNWLPNPDLEPENGASWTTGIDVAFSPSLTGQFTYFGSRLNDRIAIQAGRWANIGLVNTNGFEAALRWQMTSEFSTFFNYTYTDAKIETGSEKGLQLAMVPYSVAQFGIGYASAGWQFNLFASYNSGARRAFFNRPDESTTEFIPSWVNLDLSARIPVTRTIGLVVYLENLADVTYEKANRIYQPGLTFRIGLQSSF